MSHVSSCSPRLIASKVHSVHRHWCVKEIIRCICAARINKARDFKCGSVSVLGRTCHPHASYCKTLYSSAGSRVPRRYIHISSLFTKSESSTENSVDKQEFTLPPPELDLDYLCNPDNVDDIRKNIQNRKGVGDIHKVLDLWSRLNSDSLVNSATDIDYETESEVYDQLKHELEQEALSIPNRSHPDAPVGDEDQAVLLTTVGRPRDFEFTPKSVVDLGIELDMLRTQFVGHTTGQKTFYFMGDLARLERALVNYTLDRLKSKGFHHISVPDIIHPSIIEACGFKTSGERTQVYKLNPHLHGNLCLAGTGEMPLAGYFCNKFITSESLPIRVATISRCYRAETADIEEEKGIYRVHQFTKVEMFGVTGSETGSESTDLMEEFIGIQKELFEDLGLHFRILDMPSQELGAPAYRKYDIEAWMPAKQFWGEISSTSNCTDYQSRRLHIKYWDNDEPKHAHTVNGTGCAVPRLIMAIMENFQNKDGSINIPEVLQPYMGGQTLIQKPARALKMKWIRLKKMHDQ